MSTFPGLVEEVPGISIDCFDEENLTSSAFFLSHCHTDHMKGLTSNFLSFLQEKNLFFYCSHISKSFLQSKFSQFDGNFMNLNFVELPLDEAKIINYIYNNVEYSITVKSISSGHCPGSLMFLFLFENKKILYTGDFRINKEDYSRLKSLHYSKSSLPLKIDNLYLDTTFLNLNFLTFPSRIKSLQALCTASRNWLEKDPKNIVILETSALYGSEYIYIELSKILKKKIHVQDKVFNIYSRMEVLKNCVTNLCESTPIHACISKTESLRDAVPKKGNIDKKNILRVVLSVQKWSGKDTAKIVEWDEFRKQTLNICYSTHASYDEIESFILYFKPKKIVPCVCHENKKTQIYSLIDKITSKTTISSSSLKRKTLDKINFSKFKTVKKSLIKSYLSSDEEI